MTDYNMYGDYIDPYYSCYYVSQPECMPSQFVLPFAGYGDGCYYEEGDGFEDYYGLGHLYQEEGNDGYCYEEDNMEPGESRDNYDYERNHYGSADQSFGSVCSVNNSDKIIRSNHSESSSSDFRKDDAEYASCSGDDTTFETKGDQTKKEREGEAKKTYPKATFKDAFRILYCNDDVKKKEAISRYIGKIKTNGETKNTTKYDKNKVESKKKLINAVSGQRPGGGFTKKCKPQNVRNLKNCLDQRVKVDKHVMQKYMKTKKLNKNENPLGKLKWWELFIYHKLGFINPV